MLIKCFVLIVSLLLFHTAHGDEVNIAGRTLRLLPPPGYCIVGKTSKQERALLRQESTLNADKVQMLQLSVECGELEELRNGSRDYINRWAKVGALKANGRVEHVPFTRSEFSSMLAKSASREQDLNPQTINKRLADAFKETGFSVSDASFRIVGADSQSAYFNSRIQVTVAPDRTRELRAIGAISVANGLPVAVYLFRVANEPETQGNDVGILQEYWRSILAAN